MTWQTEFPDYPAADMPPIPSGFVDTSWRNDLCPSFVSERLRLRLWVDYADPAARECGEESPRFGLQETDEDGGPIDDSVLYDGDDWATVLSTIDATAEARAFAAAYPNNDTSDWGLLAPLVAEFEAWTLSNGFDGQGDALEIRMFAETTPDQRAWLDDFTTRWDAIEGSR